MDKYTFTKHFNREVDHALMAEAMGRNLDPEYAHRSNKHGLIHVSDEGRTINAILLIEDFSNYDAMCAQVNAFGQALAHDHQVAMSVAVLVCPAWMQDATLDHGKIVEKGEMTDIYTAQGSTFDGQLSIVAVYKMENDQTGMYWAPRRMQLDDTDILVIQPLLDVFIDAYRAARAQHN